MATAKLLHEEGGGRGGGVRSFARSSCSRTRSLSRPPLAFRPANLVNVRLMDIACLPHGALAASAERSIRKLKILKRSTCRSKVQ